MTGVPISWYLILSAVLFVLGVAGFLFRRNIITIFMSIELMLNAVNLTFIAFSYQLKQVDGHLFTFFVMVVAAAEAAVSAAALTVYDMCKAIDRGMVISGIRLEEKRGGKSGTWRRQGSRTTDKSG